MRSDNVVRVLKQALLLAVVGLASQVVSACVTDKPVKQEGAESWRCAGVSDTGNVRVYLTPLVKEVPLRKFHTWAVRIEAVDGTPLAVTRVMVDGGMPDHGHGLPTKPRVIKSKAVGEFLIEGLKFHMPGLWNLDIILQQPFYDKVSFSVTLDS